MNRWRWQISATLAAVVLLTSSSVLAISESVAPRGTLVIMGGAVRGNNAEIWRRVIELTGKSKPRFAIIAAAAGDPVVSSRRIAEALAEHGGEGFMVPIAPRLKDSDYRKNAQDPDIARDIANADGVFFTGGDQSRITEALTTADGKPSRALDAIWSVYRRGGVVAGTSAGAAIMSRTMFNEPPDVLTVLRLGVKQGSDIALGLGFLAAPIFVDQHLIVRGRFARMIPAMHAGNYRYGMGVDENTAMVITAEGTAEVVGASGVILVDTTHANIAQTPTGLRATQIRLSYLERGDRINLKEMLVTPSDFKRQGRVLNPNDKDYRPEFNEPKFYADMLGKSVLTEVLTNLIDNTSREVRGIAFAAPGKEPAASGFEFRFRKGVETRGYLRIEHGAAHYTVLNVELDILPVRIAVPFYRSE